MTQKVFDNSVWHGYKEFPKVCETIKGRYGTGGNNVPLIVAITNEDKDIDREKILRVARG